MCGLLVVVDVTADAMEERKLNGEVIAERVELTNESATTEL